jgi:hypothetical protein
MLPTRSTNIKGLCKVGLDLVRPNPEVLNSHKALPEIDFSYGMLLGTHRKGKKPCTKGSHVAKTKCPPKPPFYHKIIDY